MSREKEKQRNKEAKVQVRNFLFRIDFLSRCFSFTATQRQISKKTSQFAYIAKK